MKKILAYIGILAGGIVLGSFIVMIVVAWQPPTAAPPGGNVMAPLNVGPISQYKQGSLFSRRDIGANRLCIRGVCREGWPDAPLSNLNRFVAGHLYPVPGKMPDAWSRTAFPFPYLTLSNAVQRFGIDPANQHATNWFVIGYSYWQPYRQVRKAFFMDQGDNSSPRNAYCKTGPDWDRNNPNDTFGWGFFIDDNGVMRSASESFLDTCIAQPGYQNCSRVVSKCYLDSTSNLRGRVLLQVRLRAGIGGLCVHDYIPGMTLGTWGSPLITNFRIGPYQLPNIEGDICFGANIHSRIEARFINKEWRRLGPDPLINFYNAGQNFTYMVKSLGVAYLTWIR